MKSPRRIKFWHVAVALIGAATIFSAVLAFSPSHNRKMALTSSSSQLQSPTSTEQGVATTDLTAGTTPTTLTVAPTSAQDTPQQVPVTVAAFEQVPQPDGESIDCKLTYSDSSTYQWHWMIVDEHGAWVTDSQGQHGHWQQTTSAIRACDNSLIGQEKL